ncbi:hypothetical protein EVAR_75408_1 [Eumeta japonica]|uniref:Uncharacterized protein n=1 Tax=Eumeta variegata TaxID=151549 RepID=A0A4C1TKU0_EUMVA|nr:hypothetical protein EVAR_75408_1 [Eumeta japonica]
MPPIISRQRHSAPPWPIRSSVPLRQPLKSETYGGVRCVTENGATSTSGPCLLPLGRKAYVAAYVLSRWRRCFVHVTQRANGGRSGIKIIECPAPVAVTRRFAAAAQPAGYFVILSDSRFLLHTQQWSLHRGALGPSYIIKDSVELLRRPCSITMHYFTVTASAVSRKTHKVRNSTGLPAVTAPAGGACACAGRGGIGYLTEITGGYGNFYSLDYMHQQKLQFHGSVRRECGLTEFLGVRALLIIARLTANEKTVQRHWSPRMWNSSTKNGTDLRLGVRALLIIARLTVNEKAVQRRWSPRMWNSSTKNGTDLRLGVQALLIIARLTANEKTVQRRWSPRIWNSSTKNGTDLRLSVRALLSIARLTVDEQTVQRRCGADFRARWNSLTKSGTDLRLGVLALLIIARLTVDEKRFSGAGFRARWNSPTKNGTDLRLGVLALLIIARLTVDE